MQVINWTNKDKKSFFSKNTYKKLIIITSVVIKQNLSPLTLIIVQAMNDNVFHKVCLIIHVQRGDLQSKKVGSNLDYPNFQK